jgi:aspartyl protease family protein
MVRFHLLLILLCLCTQAYGADKVEVLGLFKDKAVIAVDGRRHVLNAGQTSPEGVRLISATSEGAVLEIDGKVGTYALGSHIGNVYKPPAEGPTVVIAPDEQGMYYVNGSINNFQVTFVVDTGSTLIAMNRNQAYRIGLDYRMEGRKSTSSTASGLVKVYLVKLDKVRVGDIELTDVPAAVHDGDYPKEILLGNSFLKQVDMTRNGALLKIQEK